MTTVAPPSPPAAATVPPRRHAAFTDRLNPILVRETLQCLNGRGFFAVFLTSLVGVAVIATSNLDASSADEGRAIGGRTFRLLFTFVFVPIVVLLVPFQAFSSMRTEMQGGTAELLLLSKLRPAAIVRGRILAVGVQFLLWLSIFAPMLALTYLLRGVSVAEILVSVALAAGFSFGATALTTALGAFTRWKPATALANAVAGAGLLFATFGIMAGFSEMAQETTRLLRSADALEGFTAIGLMFGSLVALLLLVGQSQLTHPNENRSTIFRAYYVVVLAAFYGWVAAFSSSSGIREATLVPPMAGLTFGLPFLLLPATEEERLSPRVRTLVPKNPVLAVLAAPFLPGRGRGYLFALLSAGTLLGLARHFYFSAGATWSRGGGFREMREFVVVPQLLAAYVAIYAGVGSFVRGRLRPGVAANWGARLLMLASLVAACVVPALASGILNEFRRVEWTPFQVLNPFWTLDDFSSDASRPMPYLIALALVAVAVNVPAMVRGVGEVLAASAARRTRGR